MKSQIISEDLLATVELFQNKDTELLSVIKHQHDCVKALNTFDVSVAQMLVSLVCLLEVIE